MNTKEVGEIRRHTRRDRSNMTAIYGCYVNANKEIISEFRRSTGMMSENEGEKYFALLRRTLSGTLGKNLIDISFTTNQVADSEEHKFLMSLRQSQLNDESLRMAFYKKVMETLSLGENYLILLGFDSYDVPFKSKDDVADSSRSDETYSYIQCAICPVKQTQPKLQYVPEEKDFHDGGIVNVVAAPEVGFLFPAFDNRSTNIYIMHCITLTAPRRTMRHLPKRFSMFPFPSRLLSRKSLLRHFWIQHWKRIAAWMYFRQSMSRSASASRCIRKAVLLNP